MNDWEEKLADYLIVRFYAGVFILSLLMLGFLYYRYGFNHMDDVLDIFISNLSGYLIFTGLAACILAYRFNKWRKKNWPAFASEQKITQPFLKIFYAWMFGALLTVLFLPFLIFFELPDGGGTFGFFLIAIQTNLFLFKGWIIQRAAIQDSIDSLKVRLQNSDKLSILNSAKLRFTFYALAFASESSESRNQSDTGGGGGKSSGGGASGQF